MSRMKLWPKERGVSAFCSYNVLMTGSERAVNRKVYGSFVFSGGHEGGPASGAGQRPSGQPPLIGMAVTSLTVSMTAKEWVCIMWGSLPILSP